jgi:filamentous hemagglutinin family protein
MFDWPLAARAPRNGRGVFCSGSFATMTAVAALMIAQRPALAGPTGGTVVDGSAGISQSGSVTNINQSSGKAIINWQGFSIGSGETVNFNQPGRSSVTLNRVIGNETSVISGALNANGQVFIVNSAGVLFGKGAQVNVGGLVASTLDITNADFMAGNYTFSGNSSASIVNQGRIHARDGGYVALLGKTVSNDGVIAATLGTVAMAAGNQITLNFAGNSLVDVTIDQGTLNALVENKRAIIANGGQVIMTAKAADAVLSAQVNNSGIIQARTMAALTGGRSGKTRPAKTGSIKLIADGGTTTVTGKLDASAPKGGDGGKIETSGNKVNIADSAVITTKAADGQSGTWLIDPDGFTIAASGGDMTGAALSNQLNNNGDVIIASTSGQGTDGNINVNDAVIWSANTLTLNATRNIYVNAVMSATGTASFAANYGHVLDAHGLPTSTVTGTGFNADGSTPFGLYMAFGQTNGVNDGTFAGKLNFSGSGTLSLNNETYVLIHSLDQLAAISGTTGHYALAQDLDPASDTSSNYNPHGAVVADLIGALDGLGHTISELTIVPTVASNTGLIGTSEADSTIHNIGLTEVNIQDSVNGKTIGVGALVGKNFANISNAFSTGIVSSSAGNIGGLIGINGSTTSSTNLISDSYSTATVTATTATSASKQVGGLIGLADDAIIERAYATGNVTAPGFGFSGIGGGLIGSTTNVTVHDSYATGTISGSTVGGLIGSASSGDIHNSHATGNVTSPGGAAGGLIGSATDVNVYDSYAGIPTPLGQAVTTVTGTSTSSTKIGGLIGTITGGSRAGIIQNSFANVNVSGGSGLGGLIGTITPGSGGFTIDSSSATGNVTGSPDATAISTAPGIGGLVGYVSNNGAGIAIENSSASRNVKFTGDLGNNAGGLVGDIESKGLIENSHAFGNVTGSASGSGVGGLLGIASTTVGQGTDIKDSSAEGKDVMGNTTVGGLVGANTGTITNSFSTSNVTGYDTSASNNIGGLVGTNTGLGSIVGSHASGTVTGSGPNASTGGLVGTNAGSITDSYATGTVTGPSGLTGGIAGTSFNNSGDPNNSTAGSITNSWYDSSNNPDEPITNSLPCCKPGTVTGGGGLTTAQFADIQFYLNGTINQVLADRAAAAQAAAQTAQAASRTANAVASNAAASATTQPDPQTAAGTQATTSSTSTKLDDNLKTIEDSANAEDQRARHHVANGTATGGPHRNAGRGGAGLGATIRSIDVDGQRFNLQGGNKQDTPGQKP